MTVSYASNSVTISGSHKTGTTTSSTSDDTLPITSGEIVSSDVGRLIAVVPSATASSQTQVRRIESVSGGTVTVHDPWVGTIASGVTWRVAHNLEDIHAIGDPDLEKIGNRTYRWNADWLVTANGFLGDTDFHLETRKTSGNRWTINPDCIVQFGILWGGEANGATKTTNGGALILEHTGNPTAMQGSSSRDADGGVLNMYGVRMESHTNGGNNYLFMRMSGPSRFIGCELVGTLGGRFYHEASELVDCRLHGNTNSTGAWSLGVGFNRAIENCFWYESEAAAKTYQSYTGVFRDCRFDLDSVNRVMFIQGGSGTDITWIDCTTFDDARVQDSGGGTYKQTKSVNFVMTDATGAALSGVTLRVNDTTDTTQGSVQTSDGSGVCGEILARFWELVNAFPSTDYAPFRIRIRQYGKLWSSLNSDIADPIRQSFALRDDSNVTETSGTAQAHTGITLTDHGGSPVSWNGKNWGITVTGNLTTNPSLTADNVRHYLHYHLAQDAAFNGKNDGLEWHNLIPMTGFETANGDYAGTIKGVRVVDEGGNPFPGITQMQADDGTYYVPPVTYVVEVTNSEGSFEARVRDGTVTIDHVQVTASTTYNFIYVYEGTPLSYVLQINKPGFITIKRDILLTGQDQGITLTMEPDPSYVAAI